MSYISVSYSYYAIHYTPMAYLSSNWKFVSFDHLSLIPPLLKSAVYDISCHTDFQHHMDEYWYENVYTMYYAKYNKIVCKILNHFQYMCLSYIIRDDSDYVGSKVVDGFNFSSLFVFFFSFSFLYLYLFNKKYTLLL